MRPFALFACLALSATALAGCAGEGAAGPKAGAFGDDGETLRITGQVVDEELVPVEGALVKNNLREDVVQTDAAGRFTLFPVEPGDWVLTVEKAGYATATRTITVATEPILDVVITVAAVALNVPYHASFTRATFVICWSQNMVGGVPCTKLIDYVAGTNVSSTERFAFTFMIPNEGMADMLVEIVWKGQAFGQDMGFYIQTPPNQPLTAAVVKYFSMSGGTPLRGWMVAGVKNRCGSGECAGVFDATPNKVLYEGVTIGSQRNATIPNTAIYLNHRTDAWFTVFYNRAGTRDYSAVPDE